MLEISLNIIKFTKGDSVAFDVDLTNADGTVYEMQSGDVLTFTVKKTVYDEEPLIQITSTSPKIYISPETTKTIEAGKYCYDIELTTSFGEVYTIVGVRTNTEHNLIVYPEVTVANG